jgi:hypothetical protein
MGGRTASIVAIAASMLACTPSPSSQDPSDLSAPSAAPAAGKVDGASSTAMAARDAALPTVITPDFAPQTGDAATDASLPALPASDARPADGTAGMVIPIADNPYLQRLPRRDLDRRGRVSEVLDTPPPRLARQELLRHLRRGTRRNRASPCGPGGARA